MTKMVLEGVIYFNYFLMRKTVYSTYMQHLCRLPGNLNVMTRLWEVMAPGCYFIKKLLLH